MGGLVVVMDAPGFSDDIRLAADRPATAGFLAFAPDLYSGRGIRCVVATISASRSDRGEPYQDIEGARRWLSAREDCTGNVGIIGFCMAGRFALLSAPRYPLSEASANYGEVPADAAQRLAGACPIVASYEACDSGLTRSRWGRSALDLVGSGPPGSARGHIGSGVPAPASPSL